MNIQFKQWNSKLETGMYQGGNVALKLIGLDLPIYDNLVAVASVNLPGLLKDEIAIKDWSENEGMYEALLNAEVITPAHRYEKSGYIESIPVCYLRKKVYE